MLVSVGVGHSWNLFQVFRSDQKYVHFEMCYLCYLWINDMFYLWIDVMFYLWINVMLNC